MSNISSVVLPPYTPTDNILLNCGALSSTTSFDGREWEIDSLPKFTPSQNILNTSTSTIPDSEQSPYPPTIVTIPYSTARMFRSKFKYTIPVSKAGQKFLRLYFYPTNYSTVFDKNNSFFSVHTANHTLLSNFSAFLNLEPISLALVKEYIITVNQSRLLEVTFTPSPNSYAFVNGIEVVSIPDKLYIKGKEDAIKMVGQNNDYYVDDSMALEKLYRLNVGGGGYIYPTYDTGLFRSWSTDEPYLFGAFHGYTTNLEIPIKYTSVTPPYTAPEIVYSTARTLTKERFDSNLTWGFQVDSGFYYLLRLYFCEFMNEITRINQRVFSIFINNQTAEIYADVIYWSGGRGIPVYKDYVVFVDHNPDGSKSKPYLWLSMQPNMET